MKGAILAGGTGSRLKPLSKVTNKHLLPVGEYPMIYHPISKLVNAGIKDIIIVTGLGHVEDMVRLLGSGEQWGVNFHYRIQQQAGGIAEALGLTEDFVGNDKVIVILGDNIFKDSLNEAIEHYQNQDSGAHVMLKKVEKPERFGVPKLDGDQIKEIVEKPEVPPSKYCITGIYMYDSKVFDFIDRLEPSERGELEITDVNNYYIKESKLSSSKLEGWWTDAGTFESYHLANDLARSITLEHLKST